MLCCLQAKHVSGVKGCERWGVDGDRGVLADMEQLGVWEPLAVKEQIFKTAIEVSEPAIIGSMGCPFVWCVTNNVCVPP